MPDATPTKVVTAKEKTQLGTRQLSASKRYLPPPPQMLLSRARKIQPSAVKGEATAYLGLLSPNGRWWLQEEQDFGQEEMRWRVVDTESRKVVFRAERHHVFMLDGGPSFWLRDSRRWVWVAPNPIHGRTNAYIFNIDEPGKVRIIPVPLPMKGEPSVELSPLGVTPDNQLLVGGCDAYAYYSQITLYSLSLNSIKPLAQKLLILLPVESRVFSIFSPKLKRFVWILELKDDELNKTSVEVWVSDHAGRNMQPVGYYHYVPEVEGELAINADGVPRDFQWLRDEKHISFTLKGSLYTVPMI